jgi:putative secretion ATPase (PEP-CTERM system associated)
MYEKHFQLRERPFALSPDPDYLYPSKVHQEALSYLRYGIEGHAGFVVITGEIGSGKTTMLQSLLGRLDQGTSVARIVNTLLDPRELLEAIMLDFGMDPTGMSKPVLLHRLGGFLVQQRQAGRLTLLVVDEAQNLTLPALEEIRMLSNLETEKSKLLQIVLIGQPELRETLSQPRLEQLRQRITVSYHLPPLDADETSNYINHRLKRAAAGAPMQLPRDVTDVIHGRSRGIPRLINVIADAALLLAYGMDRRDIDAAIVREAIQELDASGVLRPPQPVSGVAAPLAEAIPAPPVAANPAVPVSATPPPVPLVSMAPAVAAPPVAGPAYELGPVPEAPVGSIAIDADMPPAIKPAARPNPPAPNRILAPHTTSASPHLAYRPVTDPHRYAGADSYRLPTDGAHRPAVAAAQQPMVRLQNGVRVQHFTTIPVQHMGFWHRLRRALFGASEVGA